jgi:hypothetical protein
LFAATALTVVVVVDLVVLVGFLAVDFLTVDAAFLVGMYSAPYVNMAIVYHNRKQVNMNGIITLRWHYLYDRTTIDPNFKSG